METLKAWPHGGWSGPEKRNVGMGSQAGGQPWARAFDLWIGDPHRTLKVPQSPHSAVSRTSPGEASFVSS